jgi:hypothetical protein
MGCGASKAIDPTVKPAVSKIVPTTEHTVSSRATNKKGGEVSNDIQKSSLSRPTLPSIPKSTAFEIPLDNLMHLPKLNLPPIDAESKRRVSQQLDELLVILT